METAAAIRAAVPEVPTIALVLGSGLGSLVDGIADRVSIPYAKLPHFPVPSVAGHEGNLVIGKIDSAGLIALQGRFHYYDPEAIVARHAGMEVLAFALVTNAAAGVVGTPINHKEVLEAGKKATPLLGKLIRRVVLRVAGLEPGKTGLTGDFPVMGGPS
jgi:purine nucleoside phosphorylase